MIHHLRRSQVDVQAYDACVEQSEWGTIYGLSWWLDQVSPNWECLVWQEQPITPYRAVLPVPVQRRYGLYLVHQPLFCQFLALYSAESLPVAVQKDFIKALLAKYALIASYQLNFPEASVLSSFTELSLRQMHTHVLSLEAPYETLHQGYNRDRKMNVKRAYQADWTCREGSDIIPLAEFFRQHHAHQIEGGAHPGAYTLLESLFQACEERGYSDLWYAEKHNRVEAGAWFVTFRQRTLYLFNAATPEGRKGNARTFLIDQFIRQRAGTQALFDFESANVTSIAEFYASFGSQVAAYYELRSNRLPKVIQWLWKLKNRLLR